MGNRPLFILNQRLAVCASMVRRDVRLADIGTDHAYLPIWMAKTGRVSHAIAADVHEHPLTIARQNIIKYHVQEMVEARLSDGLKNILPDEADDIVIAGMGGEVIEGIISAAPWLKEDCRRIILQPMTFAEPLRLFLAKEGYSLCRERAVQSEGKVYSVMQVQYTGKQETDGGVLYPYIGLLEQSLQEFPQDREAFGEYVLRLTRHLENQLKGVAAQGEREAAAQLSWVIHTLKEKSKV